MVGIVVVATVVDTVVRLDWAQRAGKVSSQVVPSGHLLQGTSTWWSTISHDDNNCKNCNNNCSVRTLAARDIHLVTHNQSLLVYLMGRTTMSRWDDNWDWDQLFSISFLRQSSLQIQFVCYDFILKSFGICFYLHFVACPHPCRLCSYYTHLTWYIPGLCYTWYTIPGTYIIPGRPYLVHIIPGTYLVHIIPGIPCLVHMLYLVDHTWYISPEGRFPPVA